MTRTLLPARIRAVLRSPLRVATVAALLVSLSFGSTATAQSATTTTPVLRNMSEVPLAPGDAIRLRFWREPALNGEYEIDEGGRAVLPLIGSRYVSTIATFELMDQLLQEYDLHLRNQQVEITFLRRIRVLGSVRDPGMYHVNPTMTVGDALALAGGATREGKLTGVQLLRGNERIRNDLELSSLIAHQLHSGDQVFVPERSWFSRNSGVVVGGVLSTLALIATYAFSR